VIDEADRLLAQSFQDWLAQVLDATRPPKPLLEAPNVDDSMPMQHDSIAPAFLRRPDIDHRSYVLERKESSCQKLLFSATLTHDPERLAALELRNPKYFVVQASDDGHGGVLDVAMEKFTMPTTLTVNPNFLSLKPSCSHKSLGTHDRL
jgi:ATP-dependent RNA helicase DDX51/DBP6